MVARRGKISRPFLVWTIILVVAGFLIFSSASLGLLARNEAEFSSVASKQFFYGLFLGSVLCVLFARIDYHLWRKVAFYAFIGSLIMAVLVLIPKIGVEHGGARRWIDLGFISFQPSEFLKIAFIAYFATWLSSAKEKVGTFNWGLLPFLIFMALLGALLLAEPDTDTFAVIMFASLAMYISAGAKWRHILAISITGVLILAVLAFTRPYVMQRIESMLDPSANNQTTGYQLNQSLIAVGSGRIWGRGFGQSIQKFNYLPEPIGDSVFAVASEEFGFVGAFVLIGVFVMFSLEGLRIAGKAPDDFGRLLSIGIVILIVSQAMVNIGGAIGVLPLTGIPLPFVSHGGTALLINLIEVGIMMNISRNSR